MPELTADYFKDIGARILKGRDALVALFMVFIVIIMIFPLNTMFMDFLLSINITFSLVLLLVTVYVKRPLELSVFPSLLLLCTLYRLSLNLATTRLILGNAGDAKDAAAGDLVKVFATFVTGGAGADYKSIIVGGTIFLIIIIVQFVVITKGATRISEVAARFTLDAMPGHQMAIDADLNAGLIDENQARERRDELRRQTDFYGAMDGASKFVRGDSIAGIIITVINILVGLIVGTVSYGMSFAEAAKIFTTLTIGDGLVSQIPALLVSVAAGLLVTRNASRANLGEELIGQLFGQRKAIGIAAALLLGLAFISIVGDIPFPKIPLLVIGGMCAAGWYHMGMAVGEKEKAAEAEAEQKALETGKREEPENIEKLLHVDPMSLEVGYALVPLVDVGGDRSSGLLGRVQMIRRQVATELGIVVPPIRIRDDIRLEPNDYVIKIHGGVVARGSAIPDRLLAMDSGMATKKIDGIDTTEPAFNLPAVWIEERQRSDAERFGYTVVDAETVVATHLTEIIKGRSHELLTRDAARGLLDNVRQRSAALVEDVVPDILNIADVQRVLQNLLRERVSIRNLEAILEVLGDFGRRTKDTEILTEYCRNALSRWLCNEYAENGTIFAVTMDPRLEERIMQGIEHTEGGSFLVLSPADVQRIVESIAGELNSLLSAGHQAVLLTGPQVRSQVKRMCESSLPMLVVLSYNEILPEYKVESLGMAMNPAD